MAPTALPNVLAADLPNILPVSQAARTPAELVAAGASPDAILAANRAPLPNVNVVPGPPGLFTGRVKTGSMDQAQVTDVNPEKFVNVVGGMELGSAIEPFGEVASEAMSQGINALRAAKAAKVAENTAEWQKINGILNVPKTGVRISPSATNAIEATTMPGRTVARLGYSADDLAKMDPIVRMNVLDSHLQNAGSAIEKAAQAATDAGKTLDVGDSAMGVFKGIKDPAMQEKMIEQFNSTAKELGIVDLRQATPKQALALRQALRSGKTFSGFSDVQTAANISKQLGGAVSGDLKEAVPDFVNLDQTYSDLRGARDAARSQVQMTLKKAPPATALQKVGQFATKKLLPRAIEGLGWGAGGYLGYRALSDMTGGEP